MAKRMTPEESAAYVEKMRQDRSRRYQAKKAARMAATVQAPETHERPMRPMRPYKPREHHDDGLTPQQRWYRANREKHCADVKAWRKANPDKFRASQMRWRMKVETSDEYRAYRYKHADEAVRRMMDEWAQGIYRMSYLEFVEWDEERLRDKERIEREVAEIYAKQRPY